MGAKRKADGGGLGPHVRALRGGRTDFEPAVRAVVIQWLLMLNERYADAANRAAGKYDGVAGPIKDGIRKRFNALADAAQVFISDAVAPWSRVSWLRAGETIAPVVQGLDSAELMLGEAGGGEDNTHKPGA